MFETMVVVAIVAVCGWYVGRRFLRQLKGRTPDCGCGCSGCQTAEDPSSCAGSADFPRRVEEEQRKPGSD